MIVSKACKQDIKRLRKRGQRFEAFYHIVDCLKSQTPIPARFKPHRLKGKWSGYLECHIESDWLLIWTEDEEMVYLARTGSHSDLFK